MEKFLKKNGEINISSLSRFLGYKSEAGLRQLKKVNKEKFEVIYLGAICVANNIDIKELEGIKNV